VIVAADTLLEFLESAAREIRDASVSLTEDGVETSVSELLARGGKACTVLHEHGVRSGDPVGILAKNGAGFLTGLFGVVHSGAVAVPIALPFTADLGAYVEHVRRIVEDAGIRFVIVDSSLPTISGGLMGVLPGVVPIPTDTLTAAEPGERVHRAPDALALIQYTSGSTSHPKGVALSHRNIIAGLTGIRLAAAISAADRWSLWLPLFHDMGLFSLLTAMSTGGDVALCQPRTFMKNPADWLSRFAGERRTITVAPNFAYDALNEARERFDDHPLDLSAWRLAFNGAEPVHQATVAAFQRNYGAFGVRPTVMYPVYGMAEATLAVCFPPLDAQPRFFLADRDRLADESRAVTVAAAASTARPVACVGAPTPGVELRVVADGRTRQEGEVGEIEIRGAPVTAGYYRKGGGVVPRAGADAGGWLATGDLGFLLDGELYVVGRSKNVLVVRGKNYFAEDVESVVRALPGTFRGHCAAMATEDEHGEYMGVVVETELDGVQRDQLRELIGKRLVAELGLASVRTSFVAPRSIPYTSSGKVRRGAITFDASSAPGNDRQG
jgi:fatty-acyl-CoA synthase